MGGRLNINMPSYQHRDSHVKDKTVSPTVLSLTWESPYPGKTVFISRRGPVRQKAYPFLDVIKFFMFFVHVRAIVTCWGMKTHICVNKFGHHWSRKWFVALRCQATTWNWFIVSLTQRDRIHLKFNKKKYSNFRSRKKRLQMSPAKWRPFC